MAGGLTKIQQETEVGEGLAVGCLVMGVSAIAVQEGPLELAFSRALASWPWSTRYPALRGSQSPLLGPILRKSAGRRRSHIAQWAESVGTYVPQLRDDEWDLRAAGQSIAESTAIAARHWHTLATSFIGGLDDGMVWRAAPGDGEGLAGPLP